MFYIWVRNQYGFHTLKNNGDRLFICPSDGLCVIDHNLC